MTVITSFKNGHSSLWSLAALIAFTTSTFSTGYGIFVSLDQTTGAPPHVTLIAASAISVFISMLGYLAWCQFGTSAQAGRLLVAPIMLFLGLSVTLSSVTFSVGGMIFWTQRASLQQVLTTQAVAQILARFLGWPIN